MSNLQWLLGCTEFSGWVPIHSVSRKERYWRSKGFVVRVGELSGSGKSRWVVCCLG